MLSSQVTCRRINTTHAVPLNSVVPYSVFDLHYSCCYGTSQVLQSKTQLVEVVFPLFINDVFLREKTDTYFRLWSLKGVSLSRHKCTEHTSEIYLNFTLCKCLCSARLMRLYLASSQKLPCFLCPIMWLMLSRQAALPPADKQSCESPATTSRKKRLSNCHGVPSIRTPQLQYGATQL